MGSTASVVYFGAFEVGLELRRMREALNSGLSNFELSADCANGAVLDLAVTGNAAVSGIQPYAVRAALTEEGTALLAQVAFQLRKPHTPASSMLSRTASGERFFSASSRWHSSTSLRASRRFALASSSVSPCEIAAGISSTKQVYPPSGAGSKTAVTLMRFRVPRRTP
jgi:hypothetical protein